MQMIKGFCISAFLLIAIPAHMCYNQYNMITKKINIGGIVIGGGAPIAVQSMTNTASRDLSSTIGQINALAQAGADLVRVSVNTRDAAVRSCELTSAVSIPLIADVHFDVDLAIAAIEGGYAKVRINPGNIGSEAGLVRLAERLKYHRVPIRVGANSGSIEKTFLAQYGRSAQAIAESALQEVALLEKHGIEDIVVSVKSSDVAETVAAYRYVAQRCGYPLHLGVTEAGVYQSSAIKSAMGIGALLLDGIGDTIRAAVTGDPVSEVGLAIDILRYAGRRDEGVEIISCPTCSRTVIDVEGLAVAIRGMTENIKKKMTVAVMGCVVNGLGEGAAADIGVAGGVGRSTIFAHGKALELCANEHILPRLKELIDEFVKGDDNE